jgi:hypothetical protein
MPLTPVALILAAAACLVATLVLLRTLGPRYRVGRLLAAAPEVSIAEARALAEAGEARYVRVAGRITSDEEFPDENDRPLVYRRKRLEAAPRAGQWRTLSDEREAVPFGIELRSEFIAVDEAALAEGLVAIPREAVGTIGDLPAEVSADLSDTMSGTDPATPARLVIEQLSAVEQATVCGVPMLRVGQPHISSGLGRPLIVTVLAPAEAIRLLASPFRRRVQAAAVLLGASVVLAAASLVAGLAGL